jgi:hypothetical protein
MNHLPAQILLLCAASLCALVPRVSHAGEDNAPLPPVAPITPDNPADNPPDNKWGGKQPRKQPLAVPCVKTWAELAKSSPIDLGENVTVRLGVEALEAPRYSAVLIYALVDGFHSNELDNPDEQLGPLRIAITAPKGAADAAGLKLSTRQRQPHAGDWDGVALFCHALPLPDEGAYTVTFSTTTGAPVATLTVRTAPAGTAAYHPWSRFHSVRWNEIEEAPIDGVLTGYMAYDRWDPAMPYFSGVDPLFAVDRADVLRREKPLPRLQDPGETGRENPDTAAKVQALVRALGADDFDLREHASRELRALLPEALPYVEKARSLAQDIETRTRLEGLLRSAQNGTLNLQANAVEAMVFFPGGLHASWPEDYFLVRWWVNGKPVILNPAGDRAAMDKIGAMRMAEQLRLRWKINWQQLGANSGDRIGVQLMYCPAGVRNIQSDIEAMHSLIEFGQMPVLSNKSEFELP